MKKFSARIVALLIALSLIVGVAGGYAVAYFTGGQTRTATSTQSSVATNTEVTGDNASKIQAIHDLIEKDYFRKISSSKLYDGAIKGMIEALNDPFSSYMDASTASSFSQSLSSSFQGIGAEVQKVGSAISIVSPIKGSPAEKAGLKPNDQIVAINGVSTANMDVNQAVDKIRGKKGTMVKLTIKRPGVSGDMTFKIKRDTIPIRTVNSQLLHLSGKPVGYIAITQFNENTDKEFADALKKLESQHMKGLIIDVRGDPGGYLQAVEKIGNLLIPDKKPIVQIQDRSGKKMPFYSTLKKKKSYPIVDLIDGGSASAAEILSGALNQAAGYKLIGVKSFGKGTVQQGIELSDQSELKLTTDKWLTPNGDWIHHKGLQPTIKVEQPIYFNAVPVTLKKGQVLKFDENTSSIANAQKMLIASGHNPGRTDGYFSEKTVQAVKAFQTASKLPVTGMIDRQTASALQTATIKAIANKKNDRQLHAAELEIVKEMQ
ncbi:MAG: S41 family peptidase [Sporolactobacillus sp.]